jgi:hypothetical protein
MGMGQGKELQVNSPKEEEEQQFLPLLDLKH